MKFKLRTLVVSAVVALSIFSCARQELMTYTEAENISLAAWVQQYAPNAEKCNDNMYIEWIHRNPNQNDSLVEIGDWVRVKYTTKTLSGNVVNTRDEQVAKIEGTYTPYTHYSPQLVYMNDPNVTMLEGQYEALQKMRRGDIVRLYLSSTYAYGATGFSDDVGYGGQNKLQAQLPVIIDSFTLVDFEADPIITEQKAVDDYVLKNWGLEPKDTIKSHFYMQLLPPYPMSRDSVSSLPDSTVKIYYTGRFLDGFVFDTNIDSVQERVYGRIINEGPLELKASDIVGDTVSVIEGWKIAVKNACFGDRFRVAFVSAYGYGIQGAAASSSSSSATSTDLSYYDYINYIYYMNAMYGGGYGGAYGGGYGYGGYGGYGYGNYYNNYYDMLYYNNLYGSMGGGSSSTEDEELEDDGIVSTEIQPFEPLIFDIYIVPSEGDYIEDSNDE